MKLPLTLLLFMTVALTVFAQAPEKMSYQAIIRTKNNNLVTNSNISLKVVVHQGTPTGTITFEENHFAKTNNNGLVSLEIGTGAITTGNFSTIPWEKGPYFIETQVDPAGGTNYNIIGITQLLSVPYALHATTAERLVGTNGSNPYKSLIIAFPASRSISNGDVNNTIECTKSATLTLTADFSSMLVGDIINLEAHNGAVLTIQAVSGVTINYNINGNALFESTTGKVSFGLMRKTGANAYIISGQ
ncbi:hypothetical protein [Flavobacterium nackdongense]|uniref:Uncharacterized protein n=1 Tax=Flavobacterium nackdongense TaxID=2547394 RepID=A0A4P6YFR1_9FLAO|nr:hypothetical protein [Flavobacterium nackdongense]QBN19615.1 hypothetical protein E1750_12665 [Flavobacterium nackdongense]